MRCIRSSRTLSLVGPLNAEEETQGSGAKASATATASPRREQGSSKGQLQRRTPREHGGGVTQADKPPRREGSAVPAPASKPEPARQPAPKVEQLLPPQTRELHLVPALGAPLTDEHSGLSPTEKQRLPPPNKERHLPSPTDEQRLPPLTEKQRLSLQADEHRLQPTTEKQRLPPPRETQHNSSPTEEERLPPPTGKQRLPPPTEEERLSPPAEKQRLPPPAEKLALPPQTEELRLPTSTEKQRLPPPAEKQRFPPPPVDQQLPPPTLVPAPAEVQCAAGMEKPRPAPHSPAAPEAALVMRDRRASIAGAEQPVAAAGQDEAGGLPRGPTPEEAAVPTTMLPPIPWSESPTAPLLAGRGRAGKKSPARPTADIIVEGLPPVLARAPSQTLMRSREKEAAYGTFAWTAGRDLPAEYRAVQEDNKMLHGELKRARQRMHEQEASLAARERVVCALRAEVVHMQAALKECSVSPEGLLQDAQFRHQLQQRDSALRRLEQRLEVTERARDSAARRHKVDLAGERKHAEALAWEVAALKDALAEKDRQARMTALHMRSLYQRLESLERTSKEQPQQTVATSVRSRSSIQLGGHIASLPPSELEPPEVRVHVMLCVVYDRPQPTDAELAERERLAAVEAAYHQMVQQRQHRAALAIQRRFRGYTARKQLEQQRLEALQMQVGSLEALTRSSTATSEGSVVGDRGSAAIRLRDRQQQAELRHAMRSRRRGFASAIVPSEAQPVVQPKQAANSEFIARGSTAVAATSMGPEAPQLPLRCTVTPDALTRLSSSPLGARSFARAASFKPTGNSELSRATLAAAAAAASMTPEALLQSQPRPGTVTPEPMTRLSSLPQAPAPRVFAKVASFRYRSPMSP